jgi:hypothetical protein
LRYFFEDFVLDTDRRELRRGANVVPTTPQVFDLLDYLIQHRDRVVSKDDLINAVWNGRIVSDAALTTRRAASNCYRKFGPAERYHNTKPAFTAPPFYRRCAVCQSQRRPRAGLLRRWRDREPYYGLVEDKRCVCDRLQHSTLYKKGRV